MVEGCTDEHNVLLNAYRALFIAYRKLADCALDASHQGFRRYELSINHGGSESLAEDAPRHLVFIVYGVDYQGI